ncbi:hypothetical protein [Aureispira anguillae]|uniref:Uncharacterized protein n=1 Tax=Aureispira anguillae TaxID=2864201 RepID=A0A915YIB5_9BACT|nr:hypothetical protein [Aureispira anguillae]BDS13413.1 hypothetical protein AsAng_0041500 [Aureispira anguillae]
MNFKNLRYTFLLLSLPFLLAAQEGNCVIFATDGTAFHLGLDNKFQNKDANTNVKITDIPEGDYWVTILFKDANRKAFKSNIRVLGNKETSYMIEADGRSWKLKQYSSVAKEQVQTLNTKQTVLAYNQTGVEVNGLKSANDMTEDMVETATEISRVHGTRNDDPESKRAGKFSGSASDLQDGATATTAPTNPAPQPEQKEGTTIINKYIETTNADGTKSIVEEKTTLIKEIVVRNGQRQMKTKRSVTHTPTDFNCLPMEKEAFIALKETISQTATDKRLDVATNGVKNQCMTPNQIKSIGDLILGDVDRNTFAIAAQPVCANPKKFPYTISDPVSIAKETQAVEDVVEDAIEENPVVDTPPVNEQVTKEKTKAELKAELKALKQKQKAEKAAAKAKAKAEKAAAKAKAKAEKAAAKAAAKKKKEAEKAAKKK